VIGVRLRHPGAAALVAVLAIGCLVVIPATFIGQNVVLQAVKGAEIIEAKVQSGERRRALEVQPRLVQAANQLECRFDLPGLAKSFTGRLSTTAGSLVEGSCVQALDFCLTFYLLFFFLRDRKAALAALRCISPLPLRETELLPHRFGNTVNAAVYGTLTVSSAQGLPGGLMFWWLGSPSPLLWGSGSGNDFRFWMHRFGWPRTRPRTPPPRWALAEAVSDTDGHPPESNSRNVP